MTNAEIQSYLREVQLMSFAQTYSLPLRTLTRMRGGATNIRPTTVAQVVACIHEDQRRSNIQESEAQLAEDWASYRSDTAVRA